MREKPPVDVGAIIERGGVSVVERALDKNLRATVGDVAGRRAIILNRNYSIRSSGERRWILAEELGHILLGRSSTVRPREAWSSGCLRRSVWHTNARRGPSFASLRECGQEM
jgi:hypothetical protein